MNVGLYFRLELDLNSDLDAHLQWDLHFRFHADVFSHLRGHFGFNNIQAHLHWDLDLHLDWG